MKKVMIALLCGTIGLSGIMISTNDIEASKFIHKDVDHDGIEVLLNARKIKFPDAKPYSENSRVMVPIRFVSEALGANVKWDGGKEVTIEKNSKNIKLTIGSSVASIDGKNVTFDAKMKINKQRTYVPLRFVSEALGEEVSWQSNWVWIGSKEIPTPEEVGIKTEEVDKYKKLIGIRSFVYENKTKAMVISNEQLPLKFNDIVVYDLWKVKQTPGNHEGLRIRYSAPYTNLSAIPIYYLTNDNMGARTRDDIESIKIKNSDGTVTRTYKTANETDFEYLKDTNYEKFKITAANYVGLMSLSSDSLILIKNPLR